MASTPLTLAAINALDQAAFEAALGFVFEKSPWIAADTWAARPFASREELHAALCATVKRAPIEKQIALIRAHPDLAGRAAIAGELTPESTREQASAGLDRLTPEQFATFTRLNQAYSTTFGFPFVICVREHTKESILAHFEQRLKHTREQEIATALDEICKIAALRLRDAITDG
jgi:2-oxo-4-hydroxy-4-carboxy-5-ureidoimidazoline decarboxylase